MEIKRRPPLSTLVSIAPVFPFEQARRSFHIGNSELFLGLSELDRTKIANLAKSRSFHKGDTLFSQGQPFRKLILLEGGCVKLTLVNAHGKEVILALRGMGEAIDLPIWATHSAHTCSAQAVTSGRALTWIAADVDDMICRMPRLADNMYLILHRHMHELERRYHEIASESAARRLACTLIRVSEQLGTAGAEGIDIHISRHELAQMSGITLFTVSRLVSQWAKLGLLVPRREALVMLDSTRLDELTSSPDSSMKDTAALP